MKRLFSLILSVLTVIAVCGTAFSAEPPEVDKTDFFVATPDSPPSRVAHSGDSLRMEVAPGSTIYFSIKNARRAEDITGLRAVVKWSKGEEYTLYPRIEYREMMAEDGETSLGYRYVIALGIVDITDDAQHTLRGSVKLAKRANSVAPEVYFTLSVKKNAESSQSSSIMCSSPSLLVDFGSLFDAATIFFYDVCRFEVSAVGQAPLQLGCSLDELTNIKERYPYAALSFITWQGQPFFDHEGVLTIPAEKGMRIYEVRESALIDRTGSYSDNEEAFVITTRRLTSYVLSDRKLYAGSTYRPEPNPLNGAAV